MSTTSERMRMAVKKKLADKHLQDIYELLDAYGGRMNLPTKTVDEYMLWEKLKADPTIKISERFMVTKNHEAVVIERINTSRK